MPNWVYNNLSIDGTAEQISIIKEVLTVARPYHHDTENGKWVMSEGGTYTFWGVVAPDNLEEYFGSSSTTLGWYDWNCEHWGTKWDMCNPEVHIDDPETLQVAFETAWSPPTEWFSALVAKFPELAISLSYEEEQGWGGEYSSNGDGTWSQTEEYDIPSSHADYASRDREDSCNCAYDDDESTWYDDCPRAEEDENVVIVVTDLTTVS